MHRIKTRTPIPPIQWVKLLQMSMQRGRTSTSLSMLAPVVVKPETVSKRASMGLGIVLLMTKGMLPIRLKVIQLKATVTKPSRLWKTWFCGFLRVRAIPMTQLTRMVMTKAAVSFS